MVHSTGPDEQPTRIRTLIVLVTTLMAVLLYLDRFCVGFAVDYIREDLDLKQKHISWFISAFFWSYALAQVPSGWLSDRYGARIMLVVYILSWSLFTGMIGAAYSLGILLLMRLGCGLGQAGAYPTSASVVSKWVPFSARGQASSIVAFGGRCGGALAPLITAHLIVLFVPLGAPVAFDEGDLLSGHRLAAKWAPASDADSESAETTQPGDAAVHLWSRLTDSEQTLLRKLADEYRALEARQAAAKGNDAERLEQKLEEMQPEAGERAAAVAALNRLVEGTDELYDTMAFRSVNLVDEALDYLERVEGGEELSPDERRRFRRFLLEGVFGRELGMLYTSGWRPVMYVYGLAGLVVAALVWLFFRNRPEEHPWANDAECRLIERGRPAGAPSPHGKPGMVPLGRLMASGSMWFVCLMQVGTNVGWLFIYAWLPRYLIDVHQLPILERGLMASIPPLVGIFGMLCGGWLTDRLTARFGLRWGRRLPMMATRFTAAFGYGLVLWLSTLSGESGSFFTSPWAYTAAFSIVALSTDMGTGAVWAFKQDVGGRYVGSILGWGNMWGNLGAAVSPLIYDFYLGEHPEVDDWNNMFLVCLGAFVISGLCALGVDATKPIAPPDEEEPDEPLASRRPGDE
ncbi:MAG: MFS transporter [Planctomycetes bacterium]|nr:MFS transporter [Planctomycetota bacterium]